MLSIKNFLKRKYVLNTLFFPSILGVSFFFFIPICLAVFYSLQLTTSGTDNKGFENYIRTFTNPMFQLGVKNFLTFSVLAISFSIIISLGLAIFLKQIGQGFGILLFSSLLPFVIPSGSTAFFWNSVFGLNGIINRILYQCGFNIIMWDSSRWSIFIPIVIYIWKFCGFFTLAFLIGLYNIPIEYYEIAKLEGASKSALFKKVTIVYLTPTLVTVLLLSFVGTFHISKELFILFGKYPNQNLYFIQHFIYNQLRNLNLSTLSSATLIIIFFISFLMIPVLKNGHTISDTFIKRGEFNIFKGRKKAKIREEIFIIIISVLFLLPILFVLSNSFMSTKEVISRYSAVITENNIEDLSREGLHFVNPSFLPTNITVGQYVEFLKNPTFLRMFWNSVVIVTCVLLFHIPVSIAASYVFYQKKEKLKMLFLIYVFIMITPLQALLTPQYILFQIFNISNSYLPIILPAIFNPIGVYIIYSQLQGFPEECIDAAKLDGAGDFGILSKIILPNIKPAIAVLIIYIFSEYWNIIEQAVVFVKNSYLLPLSVYLSNILQENIGIISSGSIIYMFPSCLLFLICLLWAKNSLEDN